MKPLHDWNDFEALLSSFTNYEKQKQFAYSPEELPLSRMHDFASEVGSPQDDYPIVHIAGSKGKGSTALILEALLTASGFSVGTYTSPHIMHLRERIRVQRQSVSEDELIALMNDYLPALERRETIGRDACPTFFELMTALALGNFSRVNVDWGILEVGLGGRLDATNIVTPALTAITSIGYEHTQVLGDTLEEIAREKAGIIKEGCPVVIADLPPAAEEVILRIAQEKNAEVILSVDCNIQRADADRLLIHNFDEPFAAPAIRGPALRANLAVAYQIHRLALARQKREPKAAQVTQALRTLELPARLEYRSTPVPLIIDGAHTAESFAALKAGLEELDFPRPRIAVFSLSSDKNVEPILETLEDIADEFILTRADDLRSTDPAELREQLGQGEVIEDPRAAVREAIRRNKVTIICGSIYLAGVARQLLEDRAIC